MRNRAVKFVIVLGVVSFFADFAYEGARSVTGPYLAILGAGATMVGMIAGLGELMGYGLRVVSGPLSERTGKFWPITLVGYFIQMSAVPLLALATTWQIAGLLIVMERVGKAIRNPPRDVMLSHATKEMGYGWGFGLHEAMDQAGALLGPLVVAAVLATRGNYRIAFAALLVPAIVTLILIVTARIVYPRPEDLDVSPKTIGTSGLPRRFWIYMIGAVLVAAGFADFSLVAYHFQKSSVVPSTWVSVFYSIAMAVSGAGSLLFGKLFDKFGMGVLVPATVISAASAPMVFLGGFGVALGGAALWGLGMGVHESIIPAAVATMVPAQRRPSAYGIFTAAFGIFWFLGSVAIGRLYEVSITGVVLFAVVTQLVAIPIFIAVRQEA